MEFANESSLLKNSGNFVCCCSITRTYFQLDGYPTIQIINCILTVPTSLWAALANFLVIIAIWRTSSLHSPSNVLLVSLALSDLGVGCVVQPAIVASSIARIKQLPDLFCSSFVTSALTGYCLCAVSLLTLTAITLDRYIAIHFHLRYLEIVTVKRATTLIIIIWSVGVVSASMYVWSAWFIRSFSIAFVLLTFTITAFACGSMYRVVRRHQTQITAQMQRHAEQVEGSPLNMPQFRRSFMSMLVLCGALLFCYLPYIIVTVIVSVAGHTPSKSSAFEFSVVLVCINSAVNPFLYCWRYQQIRAALTKLVRGIF